MGFPRSKRTGIARSAMVAHGQFDGGKVGKKRCPHRGRIFHRVAHVLFFMVEITSCKQLVTAGSGVPGVSGASLDLQGRPGYESADKLL